MTDHPAPVSNLSEVRLFLLESMRWALIGLHNCPGPPLWSDQHRERILRLAASQKEAVRLIARGPSAEQAITLFDAHGLIAKEPCLPASGQVSDLWMLERIADLSLRFKSRQFETGSLPHAPIPGDQRLYGRQVRWLAVLMLAWGDVQLHLDHDDVSALRRLGDTFHNVPETIWMRRGPWDSIWFAEVLRYGDEFLNRRSGLVQYRALLEGDSDRTLAETLLGCGIRTDPEDTSRDEGDPQAVGALRLLT